MAITTKQSVRIFRYDGTDLPDPSPRSSPDRVKELLAVQYPALTNAIIDGPTVEGGQQVYKLKVSAGTKG